MEKITLNQFIFSQPNSPIEKPTDKGYLILANRLLTIWQSSKIMNDLPDALKQNVVLGIVGYYQDIIADSGVYVYIAVVGDVWSQSAVLLRR